MSQVLLHPVLNLSSFEDKLRIQVKSPKGVNKVANSICCVVDVSGSMASSAAIQTSSGINDMGYSILDIVKHSLNTIVDNLGEDDHIQLITFSTSARTIFDLQSMNKKSKNNAKYKIEKLDIEGSTQLWKGLKLGIKSMEKQININRNQHLILFTDGQPDYVKDLDIVKELGTLYDKYSERKPNINTFGFGYHLNSALLRDIAQLGSGSYYFIPDSSFVGTVFTNSIATLQTTFVNNAQIKISPLKSEANLEINQIKSGMNTQKLNDGSYIIKLGNLNYDSSKDIIITEKENSELLKDYSVELSYYQDQDRLQTLFKQQATQREKETKQVEIERELLRLEVIESLPKQLSERQASLETVNKLIAKISDNQFNKDIYIKALLEDLNGQIKIALSQDEYLKKWGIHYLPSLAMAHTHKQCSNFKDPGVQPYAGELFSKLRDQIEKSFLSSPPPEPSYNPNDYIPSYQQSSRQFSQPPGNWSTYLSKDGPCFDGEGEVLMGDGSTKKVEDIRYGDFVFSPHINSPSKILCVVQTEIKDQKHQLVTLGTGFKITPWHPVRINNQWVFPNSLSQVSLKQCSYVYSFLLESGHSMRINGVECVTLGHGFLDNDVVKHDYFGTHKVIQDLKWMKGWWMYGFVKLNPNPIIRDSRTHQVIGLRNNRPLFQQLQYLKNLTLRSILEGCKRII